MYLSARASLHMMDLLGTTSMQQYGPIACKVIGELAVQLNFKLNPGGAVRDK